MGIELFERAAEGRGRILRVERRAPSGYALDPTVGLAFMLTFDVGRILVGCSVAGDRLEITHLDVGEPVPAGLEDIMEEEPWWRVIGNPICRAWASVPGESPASKGAPASVCLQFREDAENPKRIAFRAEAPGIRVEIHERAQSGG